MGCFLALAPVWAVAAAILAAGEPGILPGGVALPQAHVTLPGGRQDARRCVVAVTRFTPGRGRNEKPLETMGAMMHCLRASGGKSASFRVPNVLLSPDVVSECDYSESY